MKDKYMVIQWFSNFTGGIWQIIGFFDDMDAVRDALKCRRIGSKQKVLLVKQVADLQKTEDDCVINDI